MYIKQQFSVCLHYFISFVSSFVFPSVNVESECVSVCDFFSLLSLLTFFNDYILCVVSISFIFHFYYYLQFSFHLIFIVFSFGYFAFFASSLTMQYGCCCCCFLKLAIKTTGYCKTFFYQLL